MAESANVKTSPRKKPISKKIAEPQNNVILLPVVKLLLLNFFITPLLFFITIFLCHETINILLSTRFIDENILTNSSVFYDFFFKKITYTNNLELCNNYVLFYRWGFVGYIVFVLIYNIQVINCIFKKSNKES
ncbi:putative membrane protein [Candidatus Phytoplasma solani]|uniref:hypothetical protein n=1 Tax=Candidatus Phytoplasma solani TaxID=69896 RepID=UPI0032DB592F